MFDFHRMRQIRDAIKNGTLRVFANEAALQQARQVLELTLAEYSKVRADYWAKIYDVVEEYLLSSSAVTSYKSRLKRAMVEAFGKVGDIAWEDGGNDLPLDSDADAWLTSRLSAEIGFIDNTFESLRLLRKEESEETIRDAAIHQAFARADGYANTLDGIYSTIKAMSAGNKMLNFMGEDGDESCVDCKRYKGKRHKASWWVAHDAIPPNRNFECHGYRCRHVLVTDSGELFTI
jgi:hypothetical protein